MFIKYVIIKQKNEGMKMAKLLETKENLIIRKPENIVRARYKLSPLAIKFLSIIIANIKRSDGIDEEYILQVKDFQELTAQKTKRIYELIEEALADLLKNPLKIPLDTAQEKFLMCNWISSAVYDTGKVSFLIDKRLKPYLLEVQEKFLKYKLENILPLKSSYSIRLYEILKDWYEINKRYGNKAEKIVKVDELREMLEIPKSYQYSSHIKKIILNKSKKELEKHTDITFDFEEIKTGRKITHIKFVIQGNSKKIISKNSQNVEENKNKNEINKKTEKGNIDFKNLKFKEFKQVLVDNYAGYYLGEYENKSITLSESGYIELDGKRVSADESFDVWEELFINRANLQLKTKEEFEEIKKAKEEEEKNNYLEKLKKEYRFRKIEVNVKNAFGNVNKIIYEVIDFLPPKNGEYRCFDLVVKGEDGKTYKIDDMRYDEFVSYLV